VSRLVVVTNRLPSLRSAERGREAEVPAGGLASAVLGALQRVPGSLWVGWNGTTAAAGSGPTALTRARIGGVQLVGTALSTELVRDHYRGFCNATLWPLLHCFQDKVHIEPRYLRAYAQVQSRFADILLPRLRDDDLVWVHDYHLVPLGRELRERGWTGRLGFFLHTPFPPWEMCQLLPEPAAFLEALGRYDLVGFHTRSFLDNYVYCCQRLLDARWDGRVLRAGGRRQRAGLYPIGIDPEDFLPSERAPRGRARMAGLQRAVRGRRIILGVDRLDYTKGIPERILAFEEFLRTFPDWRKRVSFVQIASPSRADMPQYAEQRARVEALVGRVNGELAEHDWVPIRYLYRSYQRRQLAGFYRDTDVGLVTPLRDGMNLVAKEFVAAQEKASPGVLVLSRCAGAAEDLPEALQVNPYHPSDVAAGIERALSMPLDERRDRHAALLERVLSGTAGQWAERFTADLAAAASPAQMPPAPSRSIPAALPAISRTRFGPSL
jgi:trehalose 6-phosphate synthase